MEGQASIYVKYDRLLHGDKRLHKGKREVLTTKFLKKFIHYAKGRTPKLTEEVSTNGGRYHHHFLTFSYDSPTSHSLHCLFAPTTLFNILRSIHPCESIAQLTHPCFIPS